MHYRLTAVLVSAAIVGAACGGGDTAAPDAQETATQAAPEQTAGDADTAAEATVAVTDSELGEILVDGDGATLYLFTNDEQGDSTCSDDCAQNWPPLVGPADAGAGADASLLATVERDDGTAQVTYNGWPLYYFAADSAAGDTNGQGVGDVWFAVDAQGEAVRQSTTQKEAGSY